MSVNGLAIGVSAATQLAQLGVPMLLTTKKLGIYNVNIPFAQSPLTTTLPDIIAMVVIEERHSDEMIITEHPVEQGASITDYAYKLPPRLTLRLGWSNSPNDLSSSILGLTETLLATIGGQVGTVVSDVGTIVQAGYNLLNSKDKIQEVYASLLELQTKKAIFDVYTQKRTYSNMMLKGLHTETDNRSVNSLPITLECQGVLIVSSETTVITQDQLATGFTSNSSMINKGTQSLSAPRMTPAIP